MNLHFQEQSHPLIPITQHFQQAFNSYRLQKMLLKFMPTVALTAAILHGVSAEPIAFSPRNELFARAAPTCQLGLIAFVYKTSDCDTVGSAGIIEYKPTINQCTSNLAENVISIYASAVGTSTYNCQVFGWSGPNCQSASSNANNNGAELSSSQFTTAAQNYGVCASLNVMKVTTPVKSFKICCAAPGTTITCPIG
ncbi:hypothetical protein NA57DRAFT_80311 [Rhizodiscina lignyota]|uniref:Uncharacterized protein n=1 Tax=Rhizodiscina lignyota TaxID=1504668 RepID=A0A9P4I7E2_9PEZI|nr:hypothetical protein NA57DRAFT_80311 [Rhizodiscina lignyota]